MPIHQYDAAPGNRYAGSIADILQQQGLIQARRAEQVGTATARAAEQSGNAWGGAVQNIGQAVAAIPGQMRQAKHQAMQDEVQALQMQGVRRTALDDQLFRQALSMSEGGDLAPAVAFLKKQGGAGVAALGKLSAMVKDQREQKNDAAGDIGYRIAKGGGTPDAVAAVLKEAVGAGDLTEAEATQFHTMSVEQPDKVPTLARELMARSKTYRPLLDKVDWGKAGEVGLDPLTHQPIAGLTIPEKPSTLAATARADAAQTETARHNAEVERVAGLTAGRAAAAQVETVRHNRATEAEARAKATQAQGDKTDLTPEGLDAAAMMFAKTGQLPALGNGDKSTRKAIINRAAVMVPGLDVASAKADFGANTASLKGLQVQRDAIGAFEATAIKNLDVFLALAAKIPDTGSPLLNKPMRHLTEGVLGGETLAAYNTARRTVIPEFAKILANPGLSGQLSDSARKEIEEVVSGNATLKQTLAAARVLKQDTENRRTSYDDQITAINARIKLGGATPAAPAHANTMRVVGPNGETGTVPVGTALSGGWRQQ
jgi:hypothetical protein